MALRQPAKNRNDFSRVKGVAGSARKCWRSGQSDRMNCYKLLNKNDFNQFIASQYMRTSCPALTVSVSLVACCPPEKIPRRWPGENYVRPQHWRKLRLISHGKRPSARDRYRSRHFRCRKLCGRLSYLSLTRGGSPQGSGLFLGCFFPSRLFSRLFFGRLPGRQLARARLADRFLLSPSRFFSGFLPARLLR